MFKKKVKMSKMPSGVERNCVHIQIISNKDRSLSLEGTQYDQYGRRRALRMDFHLHVLIFQPLITASNFPINTKVNNQSTRAQVWVALSPSVVCCGRHKAATQAPSLVWQEPGLHPWETSAGFGMLKANYSMHSLLWTGPKTVFASLSTASLLHYIFCR